jgi:hypothetical protein
MRGGALIQHKLPGLEGLSFVHVICALMSRTTTIQRVETHELVAHSLPPIREYSVTKIQKFILPTTGE